MLLAAQLLDDGLSGSNPKSQGAPEVAGGRGPAPDVGHHRLLFHVVASRRTSVSGTTSVPAYCWSWPHLPDSALASKETTASSCFARVFPETPTFTNPSSNLNIILLRGELQLPRNKPLSVVQLNSNWSGRAHSDAHRSPRNRSESDAVAESSTTILNAIP